MEIDEATEYLQHATNGFRFSRSGYVLLFSRRLLCIMMMMYKEELGKYKNPPTQNENTQNHSNIILLYQIQLLICT